MDAAVVVCGDGGVADEVDDDLDAAAKRVADLTNAPTIVNLHGHNPWSNVELA